MRIECPSCTADNKIETTDSMVCSECNKSLAGHSYKKFQKPLISVTTAFFIGIFGTYKADQLFFEEDRYPVRVEYEIVDSCINSARSSMNTYQYIKKSQTCICALEKTMGMVSYSDLEENESEFLTRFKSSIASCP